MSILFISPDEHMAAAASRAAIGFPDKVIVVQGLLADAMPVARRFEREGVDVIISRGGTMLMLRKAGISTPVVELQVTGRDLSEAMVRAIRTSGKPHPRLGVICYPNMMQQLRDFAPCLSADMRFFELPEEILGPRDTDSVLGEILETATASGIDVVLGGVITVRAAESRNLPAVLIESGEASVAYALEEARRIAYARRLEMRRTEELRAVLDNAYEGVVAVNTAGDVTLCNPVARQLLGEWDGSLPPSLDLASTLSSGSGEIGKLVRLGRSMVMMNKVPIRVGGRIAGVVATFQDVTRIQDMEARIRRECSEKGHVAKYRFSDITSRDPAMIAVLDLAKRYARSGASVLIRGETGVGKELIAQSIHNESDRAGQPFVAVNCAALPDTLLESELFGYVDGAFTGASKKGKPGLFELAHLGTIFLDEVSEIPLSLQGRLLRVLQEQEVMRLGHDRIILVNVRVIAASNRDLRSLVEAGAFRADLYWRLNVLGLSVPPLRERRDDIPPLLESFLEDSAGCPGGSLRLSSQCLEYLTAYDWPGNIRELKNFCERVSVVCRGGTMDAERVRTLLELPIPFRTSSRERRREGPLEGQSCAGPTDRGISDETSRVMRECGSVAEAARRLGVHRTTLWRRIRKLRIEEAAEGTGEEGRGFNPVRAL